MTTDKTLDDVKYSLLKQLPKIGSIKDLVAILQAVLETLGQKTAAASEAPTPQPEKPEPKGI
jgi:hypothetical protein